MVQFKDPVITRFFAETAQLKKKKIKTVYLFGSRAKGTERPDSDYDLLLVVKPQFTVSDKDSLYSAVLHVLFETGKLVSLKILKEKEFSRLRRLGTPFMQHVLTEGVRVG